MVRSTLVIVTDDQGLIQKAQGFGHANGVSVQVMSAEQWQTLNTKTGPALTVGGLSEGAKVLQFPGTPVGGDARKGVSTINQLESVAIENAISAFKGNLTEAAKALGIGRATLYRKVKQYNIDPSSARKKKAA